MHGIAVETRRRTIVLRPLRNGDTETVAAVFSQLGPESQRLRFGMTGLPRDLASLARVDGRRHVVVAYAGRDPVAIGHLAVGADRHVGEIAVAVADDWQRAGIGSALVRELTDLAVAAGITHIRAVVKLENRASLSLVRRAFRVLTQRIEGGELHVLAPTT
jgi:L-amino acid N-acyltransferase YncA